MNIAEANETSLVRPRTAAEFLDNVYSNTADIMTCLYPAGLDDELLKQRSAHIPSE